MLCWRFPLIRWYFDYVFGNNSIPGMMSKGNDYYLGTSSVSWLRDTLTFWNYHLSKIYVNINRIYFTKGKILKTISPVDEQLKTVRHVVLTNLWRIISLWILYLSLKTLQMIWQTVWNIRNTVFSVWDTVFFGAKKHVVSIHLMLYR